jgi:hypothetical protein
VAARKKMIRIPTAAQAKMVNLVSQWSTPKRAGGKNSPTVGGK